MKMHSDPSGTPPSSPQVSPTFVGAALKLLLVIVLLALLLTACGGGTNPQPKPGASTWDNAKWDSAAWQP